ncbi:entericidin A/B family lipoprotein [Geomonas oryzae]|nr:entericidin A/B family lipoprotein [Geomonas oryzae]
MWTLAGCHTVKGVGEDVQSGGKAIERSSGR